MTRVRVETTLNWSLENGAWADITLPSGTISPEDLSRYIRDLELVQTRLDYDVPQHHRKMLTREMGEAMTSAGMQRVSPNDLAPFFGPYDFAQYRHRRVWVAQDATVGPGVPYIALGDDEERPGRLRWRAGRIGYRLSDGISKPDTATPDEVSRFARLFGSDDSETFTIERALEGDPTLTIAVARQNAQHGREHLSVNATRADKVAFTPIARVNRDSRYALHFRVFAADVPGPDGKPFPVAAIVEAWDFKEHEWTGDNANTEGALRDYAESRGLHFITPQYLPEEYEAGPWKSHRESLAYLVKNPDLFTDPHALLWLGEQGNQIAQGRDHGYRKA